MKTLFLTSLLLSMILLSGCPSGGREPNPISIQLPGDEEGSCRALELEMKQIKSEMASLEPKLSKFGTNVIWFIIWAPLMDVKDAEKIEYDAFRRRYNRLYIIAKEKDCDFVRDVNYLVPK